MSKNKFATQSTTAASHRYDPNRNVAGNAGDRNITTCMRTYGIGPTSPEKTVWWKVDLGGEYNIYSVSIKFKNYPVYGIFLFEFFLLSISNSCTFHTMKCINIASTRSF